MQYWKCALSFIISIPILISCAQDVESEISSVDQQSCPRLNVDGKPSITEDRFMTDVSLRVKHNGSLIDCHFKAMAEKDGRLFTLATGSTDYYQTGSTFTSINFRVISSKMPTRNQLIIATFEGNQVKQLLWGNSSSLESELSSNVASSSELVKSSCSENIFSFKVEDGSNTFSGSVYGCQVEALCRGSSLVVIGTTGQSQVLLSSKEVCQQASEQLMNYSNIRNQESQLNEEEDEEDVQLEVSAQCQDDVLSFELNDNGQVLSGSIAGCQATVSCKEKVIEISSSQSGVINRSSLAMSSGNQCQQAKSRLDQLILAL